MKEVDARTASRAFTRATPEARLRGRDRALVDQCTSAASSEHVRVPGRPRARARTGRRAVRPARAPRASRSDAASRPLLARPSEAASRPARPASAAPSRPRRSSSPRVLAVVDEHALALVLQPFGRDQPRVPLLEPSRHALRERVGLLEGRSARNRDEHVNPVGAARLDVGLELEPLSSSRIRWATRIASAKPPSGGSRSKSTKSGRCGLSTRVPSVHVDAVHLHHPEHRLRRVDEREVDEPRPARAGKCGRCASGSRRASPSAPASGSTPPRPLRRASASS